MMKMMRFVCLMLVGLSGLAAADPGADALQGVWQAESLESGGRKAPEAAAKSMRFTFKSDKLLIKGNFQNDREEECTYKLNTNSSPQEIEFSPPKVDKAILGIYRIRDQKLQVCFRRDTGGSVRPKEFSTGEDDTLVMVTFTKVDVKP